MSRPGSSKRTLLTLCIFRAPALEFRMFWLKSYFWGLHLPETRGQRLPRCLRRQGQGRYLSMGHRRLRRGWTHCIIACYSQFQYQCSVLVYCTVDFIILHLLTLRLFCNCVHLIKILMELDIFFTRETITIRALATADLYTYLYEVIMMESRFLEPIWTSQLIWVEPPKFQHWGDFETSERICWQFLIVLVKSLGDNQIGGIAVEMGLSDTGVPKSNG
jgi:hypothetical protein